MYICEIDTNEGNGRQKIYWDDEEKTLCCENNENGEVTVLDYRCETPEASVEISFALWNYPGSPWHFVRTTLDGTPIEDE